ncbi:prepilin-type N-terminal cleavage/methylation domain-containing protein [Blautia sp. HCN-1074]|jgi:prepilin-type N-terminal cleavage/methylation domain-containing protein|uniref:prepilin-type N-terminal cleavage/methylation domain-containing protein n=1 Tax=Blautia sp. HCN-1074 TaxID=3134667 RepID=UPI000E43FD90|nr:prepilin-type N-terminal cleavage/methylation domain-containing protein [Ruminococcus sp. TM10-9AT]RGW23093.1 prepilin-type N-terminal cleavage/methylation domain-containing protein [Ruminococcus sp. AF13-37]RGW24948.1 prepilin-type N-terminal cleavage/methylation domain-containing protein [Ruminococcus sp. AF13-28]RHK00805.1 prepilin-type N-terminal cleavage/methylation domain-containing protein [Ruminococcus sp. AM07-21]RHT54767.1 prepilin-type N-terminal cleavage/methylation domain-contai
MKGTQRRTIRKEKNNSAGFTLIEMIVTVAIIAIFSGVVVTLITTGSSLFRGVSGNTKSQVKAQETLDEIEDLIIDANRSIYYAYGSGTDMGTQITSDIDDSNAASKTFIACNEYENGDGTSRYVFDVLDWVGSEGKLYYSQREYTKASSNTEEENENGTGDNSENQQTVDTSGISAESMDNGVAVFASADNDSGNGVVSGGSSDKAKDSKELIARSVFAEGIENFTADVTKVESERIVRFRLTTEENGKKVKTLHTVNLRNRIQVMKPDDAFATASSTDVRINIVGAPDSIDAGKSKILGYNLTGNGSIDPTTLKWKIVDGTEKGYFPELDPTYGKLTVNDNATGTVTVIVFAKTSDGKQTVTSAPVTIKINNTKTVTGIKTENVEIILGLDTEETVSYDLNDYIKWSEVYSDNTDSGNSYVKVVWSGGTNGTTVQENGLINIEKSEGTSQANGVISVNASYEVGGKAFSATATVNLARLEIINPSGEYYLGDNKVSPEYNYYIGGKKRNLSSTPQFTVDGMTYQEGNAFTTEENGEWKAKATVSVNSGSLATGHSTFSVNTDFYRMNIWCKNKVSGQNVTTVYPGNTYDCSYYNASTGFYVDADRADYSWKYSVQWKILKSSSEKTSVSNDLFYNDQHTAKLYVDESEQGFSISAELTFYVENENKEVIKRRYKGVANIGVVHGVEIVSPKTSVVIGNKYPLKAKVIETYLSNPYSNGKPEYATAEIEDGLTTPKWSIDPSSGGFDSSGVAPWDVQVWQQNTTLSISVENSHLLWVGTGDNPKIYEASVPIEVLEKPITRFRVEDEGKNQSTTITIDDMIKLTADLEIDGAEIKNSDHITWRCKKDGELRTDILPYSNNLNNTFKLEYDKKKMGVYVVTAVYKSDRGTETESEPYTITVTDN